LADSDGDGLTALKGLHHFEAGAYGGASERQSPALQRSGRHNQKSVVAHRQIDLQMETPPGKERRRGLRSSWLLVPIGPHPARHQSMPNQISGQCSTHIAPLLSAARTIGTGLAFPSTTNSFRYGNGRVATVQSGEDTQSPAAAGFHPGLRRCHRDSKEREPSCKARRVYGGRCQRRQLRRVVAGQAPSVHSRSPAAGSCLRRARSAIMAKLHRPFTLLSDLARRPRRPRGADVPTSDSENRVSGSGSV